MISKKNYFNYSVDNDELVCNKESFADYSKIKRRLRRLYLQKRLLLKQSDILDRSKAVSNQLIDHSIYKTAGNIALYSPICSEVDTSIIFKTSIELRKHTFFPKVYKDELRFYEITDLSQLKTGSFGVKEPAVSATGETALKNIDLFIIPAICFDISGNRIGYGKGFYDRTLCNIKSNKLVGIVFNFQIIDSIPTQRFDKHVGFIATESGVTKTYRGGN